MKCKMLWVAIIALLFPLAGMSQKSFDWGPKVGINFSTITSTGASSWRTGVHAGFFARQRYNSFIGAQAELMYSTMGANYDGGHDRLGYITIPVVANVFLIDKLALQVGPQFGFKVYDKITYPANISMTGTKSFNTFDLEFLVGLGYEFNFGLIADFRYGIGLTNAVKSSHNGGKNNKNEMFQLSVGWKF